MTRRRLFLLAGLLLLPCAIRAADIEPSKPFISPLSPDLDIVTQVSNLKPYVGQQFSVVYSLRTARAPAAVDLDPQQYSGFWAEIAKLPEQPRPTVRLQNGRFVSEYLLRQVIAFPLWPGSLELPPLRVKVRNSTSRTSSGDWDVIGTSIPVPVVASPLAPASGHASDPPLVGELEGVLSIYGVTGSSSLLLELKGTANLAMCRPNDWLKSSPGTRWSVRLKDWENTIQTLDTGAQRQLRLLQWRRWIIRPIGQQAERVHIDDLVVPVFQPGPGQWASVRIRGLDFKGNPGMWSSADSNQSQALPAGRAHSWTVMAAVSGLTLLLVLGAWFVKRIQRRHNSNPDYS